MAELFPGRVVHVELSPSACRSKERLLAHLLENTEGVVSFHIDPDTRTLTAYLDETHVDDATLVRVLVTSGLFPASTREVGVEFGGDNSAC